MDYSIILLALLIVTYWIQRAFRLQLYRDRREMLATVGIFFVVGVAWDSYAIWRGDWSFPSAQTLGFKIGLMPIEEYFFILIVPYFIITIYRLIARPRR